jgi:MFS family permease
METVILGWYIMVQTGSVLLLTTFGSLLLLGTLASPMFGVLGDRLGFRVMLSAMRAIYTGLAALVLLLALTDTLTPAWVLVVASLAGLVRPNDQVMRNALIGETIPPPHLMGAVGLSRVTMDSARIFGALGGAALSTVLGLGPTYALVTIFYVASLALTFGVARRPVTPDPAQTWRGASSSVAVASPSRGRDLLDGLLYVLRLPALHAMMWLAFLVNLTAYPVSSGLLPYVARNIYLVDATGLGWLAASFALGSLVGSIVTVVTGGPRRPERSMLIYTALRQLEEHQHGASRAAPRRLRAERGDDRDDREPARGVRRALSRARHGRAYAGDLRHAARAHGRGRAHRAHRLRADGQRLHGGGSLLHPLHRRQVAREPLAAAATAERRDTRHSPPLTPRTFAGR